MTNPSPFEKTHTQVQKVEQKQVLDVLNQSEKTELQSIPQTKLLACKNQEHRQTNHQ